MVQDVVNLADKADTIMSVSGDMVYFTDSRQRLAKSDNDKILQLKSGLPSWQTLTSSTNVEILNDQTLTSDADNITYTPSEDLDLVNDYSMIKVIFSGDTTDTADLDFTVSSGGYISEYHNFYYNLIGSTGSNNSDTSASTCELQSTAEINVARNCFFNLDITNVDYNQSTYNILFTYVAGCVNRCVRFGGCGTVASGTGDGAIIDGIKIALSANDFQEKTQMTTLGFKR